MAATATKDAREPGGNERALRLIAIGRHNWTFADSDDALGAPPPPSSWRVWPIIRPSVELETRPRAAARRVAAEITATSARAI